jgi:hypothetical protein
VRQYTDSVSATDPPIIDHVTAMQLWERGAWTVGGPCSIGPRYDQLATDVAMHRVHPVIDTAWCAVLAAPHLEAAS